MQFRELLLMSQWDLSLLCSVHSLIPEWINSKSKAPGFSNHKDIKIKSTAPELRSWQLFELYNFLLIYFFIYICTESAKLPNHFNIQKYFCRFNNYNKVISADIWTSIYNLLNKEAPCQIQSNEIYCIFRYKKW